MQWKNIVIETEKYTIDLFVEVLKENLPKKYTIRIIDKSTR